MSCNQWPFICVLQYDGCLFKSNEDIKNNVAEKWQWQWPLIQWLVNTECGARRRIHTQSTSQNFPINIAIKSNMPKHLKWHRFLIEYVHFTVSAAYCNLFQRCVAIKFIYFRMSCLSDGKSKTEYISRAEKYWCLFFYMLKENHFFAHHLEISDGEITFIKNRQV